MAVTAQLKAAKQLTMVPLRRFALSGWDVFASLLGFLFCIPLLVIFAALLLPAPAIWAHLIDTVLIEYIKNSLLLVLGVGVGSLLLGIIPAWLVTMYRFPMSRWLTWGLLLPLAMPAYIIAYCYTGILTAGGPLQLLLQRWTGLTYHSAWFPEIRSLGGAIIMLALVLYPYVYLLARAAFIEQSLCVIEVARSLGCSSVRAFTKVALPLARPAITVGLSLVAMETLADYGTVQYFGIATFTTGIFKTWFGLGSSVAAAQLSACLFTGVMLVLYLEKRSRRQARFHHTSSRYSTLLQQPLSGYWALGASLFCLLPLVFGFIIPVYFLVMWGKATYSSIIDDSFYQLLANSVALALLTAFVATLIALLLAYINRHSRSTVGHGVLRLVGTGYAMPGTIIAIGTLIPFAWLDHRLNNFLTTQFGINSGLLMSGTLFALVFAYLVRFLAIAINTVGAGLEKIKPVMDEVAKTAGLSLGALLVKVHIPMLKGSLVTALLLVFVEVMKELPATLILRPFNFNTLAVRTFELANEERLAAAAVPALAIVLASLIPVIVMNYSISNARPSHQQQRQ